MGVYSQSRWVIQKFPLGLLSEAIASGKKGMPKISYTPHLPPKDLEMPLLKNIKYNLSSASTLQNSTTLQNKARKCLSPLFMGMTVLTYFSNFVGMTMMIAYIKYFGWKLIEIRWPIAPWTVLLQSKDNFQKTMYTSDLGLENSKGKKEHAQSTSTYQYLY